MLSHDLARELLARRNSDVRIQVVIDDDPTGVTYRTTLVQLRNEDDTLDADLRAEPVVTYDSDADAVVIRAGAVVLTDPDEPAPRCPNCAPGYDCESGIYAPEVAG